MFDEIFARHKRVSLMYSGGKDSLCCLLLARPWWDRLDVVWVDTGNQFPEVVEHMERVKALVPHFTVLHSDTRSYFGQHGFPVDVVPTRHTEVGQYIYGPTSLRMCSRFECCNANIWSRLEAYRQLVRPTCIVRGDRGTERAKGPENDGDTEYAFPIWDWTDEQVRELVRSAPEGLYQPRHEMDHGTSLDCMTCTAYNDEHKERMAYLKKYHPELWKMSLGFFKQYKAAVWKEMMELEE